MLTCLNTNNPSSAYKITRDENPFKLSLIPVYSKTADTLLAEFSGDNFRPDLNIEALSSLIESKNDAGGGLGNLLEGLFGNKKMAPPPKRSEEKIKKNEEKIKNAEVPAPPFHAGQMDYEIPDVMQQNVPTICIIRIGDEEIAPEDLKISMKSVHATIEISDEMSVKLVDISNDENFEIVAISNEKQAITEGKITEWKISVKPLKAGTSSIFLRISLHFNGKTKDLEVLEKSIRVNGNPNLSIDDVAKNIKKKIVFLAADSKSGLLLGRESNKIREELLMSSHRDDFLYTTQFEVTGFEFSRTLLREKPTIVHFSGHGSSEGIFLVNENEVPQLAPTNALKKLFDVLEHVLKIECVILNACFSKNQADEVSESVPIVVGTQSKIGDSAAINFSIGFYQGLGEGLSYEDAFELGRVQVKLNANIINAEDVLVLLKKN